MNNQSLAVLKYPTTFRTLFSRILLLVGLACCSSASLSAQIGGTPDEKFVLQVEDTLRIAFPAAPELDVELQIRRDGVISLPIVGEILAAGKTPSELERLIASEFEDQLVSNEVVVSVIDSNFTYYLEGEVKNPGIILSARQLSVLEAIIAAGGIDKVTGKMKKVVVIRRKGSKYQRFELDLAAIIDGKKDTAFVLESYDIVSIPPRVW